MMTRIAVGACFTVSEIYKKLYAFFWMFVAAEAWFSEGRTNLIQHHIETKPGVVTDASDWGLGAVLSQGVEGVDRPVLSPQFCSNRLNAKDTCAVKPIKTVSVPRIVRSKYKYKYNVGSRKNIIVIKPEKFKVNEQKQFLKFGLINIRSLAPKAVIVNEMITDNSFDLLCLTETWLKPNDYFGLNESTPPNYCYKHEPRQTGRGGGVATIYSDILNVTQKTGYRFNSFEILLLNVTLSDMQKKSNVSLALATVYRPPGPYTEFLKEFADFLSDLLVTVDKALIMGDFNIHVDNANDTLGLAFTDLINSFGVKQNVTGPTHRFNHTLDLIISHGIDLTAIDIVPQSDDITDHFLVSCMLRITDQSINHLYLYSALNKIHCVKALNNIHLENSV
ncbi:uncharacterized protein LOC127939525 [Carassius gibelio]|uniref:uncharacterized protein LOC127939525 n=1 Tax=Carassius gibelio TaxID=101364 RepID=UPI002277EFF8|nr:uncharacterized protein LOC127939525 [Carassius gibelio]